MIVLSVVIHASKQTNFAGHLLVLLRQKKPTTVGSWCRAISHTIYISFSQRKGSKCDIRAHENTTKRRITRPKPLPNELLSDLAVSTATKLQIFRHLGKYFKQCAKALEKQDFMEPL